MNQTSTDPTGPASYAKGAPDAYGEQHFVVQGGVRTRMSSEAEAREAVRRINEKLPQKWVFRLEPGSIASYLGVIELDSPAGQRVGAPGVLISAIYMSHERGVVVGMRSTPIDNWPWPPALAQAIKEHFAKVFELEHENWRSPGPSPRAVYVDSLKPWEITIEASA